MKKIARNESPTKICQPLNLINIKLAAILKNWKMRKRKACGIRRSTLSISLLKRLVIRPAKGIMLILHQIGKEVHISKKPKDEPVNINSSVCIFVEFNDPQDSINYFNYFVIVIMNVPYLLVLYRKRTWVIEVSDKIPNDE